MRPRYQKHVPCTDNAYQSHRPPYLNMRPLHQKHVPCTDNAYQSHRPPYLNMRPPYQKHVPCTDNAYQSHRPPYLNMRPPYQKHVPCTDNAYQSHRPPYLNMRTFSKVLKMEGSYLTSWCLQKPTKALVLKLDKNKAKKKCQSVWRQPVWYQSVRRQAVWCQSVWRQPVWYQSVRRQAVWCRSVWRQPVWYQSVRRQAVWCPLAQLPRTQFTHSKPPNPHARKTSTQNFRTSYWHSYPERNLHTASRQTRMPGRHPRKIFAPPIGTATPNAIYTQQAAKPACQEDIHAKFSQLLLAQLPRTQFTHSAPPNPHASRTSTQNFRSSYLAQLPWTQFTQHAAKPACQQDINAKFSQLLLAQLPRTQFTHLLQALQVPRLPRENSGRAAETRERQSVHQTPCRCSKSHACHAKAAAEQRRPRSAKAYIRPRAGAASPTPATRKQRQSSGDQGAPKRTSDPVQVQQVPRLPRESSGRAAETKERQSVHQTPRRCSKSHATRTKRQSSGDQGAPKRTSDPVQAQQAPRLPRESSGRAAQTKERQSVHQTPRRRSKPHACHAKAAAEQRRPRSAKAYIRPRAGAESPTPATRKQRQGSGDQGAPKRTSDPVPAQKVPRLPRESSGRAAETRERQSVHQTPRRRSKSHACHAKAAAEQRRPRSAKAYIRPRAGAASPTPATRKQRQSSGDQGAPKRTSDPAQVPPSPTPDIKHCDIKLCDVKLCDVKLCDVKLCDVKLCDVELRDVNLRDVKLRDVKQCDVKLYDVCMCCCVCVCWCCIVWCDVKLCDVCMCCCVCVCVCVLMLYCVKKEKRGSAEAEVRRRGGASLKTRTPHANVGKINCPDDGSQPWFTHWSQHQAQKEHVWLFRLWIGTSNCWNVWPTRGSKSSFRPLRIPNHEPQTPWFLDQVCPCCHPPERDQLAWQSDAWFCDSFWGRGSAGHVAQCCSTQGSKLQPPFLLWCRLDQRPISKGSASHWLQTIGSTNLGSKNQNGERLYKKKGCQSTGLGGCGLSNWLSEPEDLHVTQLFDMSLRI